MKRYSLSGDERIKGKKSFDQIYSTGRIIISSDKRFKATYTCNPETDNPGIKIAAAVSSKAGSAVWRNRVKRLIKEVYRLNKEILIENIERKKLLVRIIFSPNFLNEKKNKKLNYYNVLPPVLEIMSKINNEI